MNGFTFRYDAEKRLSEASNGGTTNLQCTYDGLGRVVRRIEEGVTTVYTYDDWKPIMEWDSPSHWVAWNVYGAGPDEILWRETNGWGRVALPQRPARERDGVAELQW